MATTTARPRALRQALRLLAAETDRHVLGRVLVTLLVVIAGGALGALSPLVLKSLVDAVTLMERAGPGEPRSLALFPAAAYLVVLLASRGLADVRPWLSGTLNQRLHSRLVQRFFDHVQRLPLDTLLKRRSGELQHVLDMASAGAQLAISHLTSSLLPVLVELVTMAVVLGRLGEPALVAVFAASALAYLAIFSVGAHRMTRVALAVSKAGLDVYGRLGDGLAHFETLRYFAAEEQASRGLQAACARLEQRWTGLHRLNFGIALAASAVFAASMGASLFIAAAAVDRHAMTLGGFVLATVYALQMVRPLESLGTAARDVASAVGYLQPLIDLLSEPLADDFAALAPEAPVDAATDDRAASIRLEDLHFGYAPNRPVIRGLDLELRAGSTTAIVGRSGSGKSSLTRLLMRLYAPQRGRILLDGRPLDGIGTRELRVTLVGLVPQDTTLLHDTIAANIALGTPAATREDILRAAHAAQLDAFIDALPLGLDTPVGERGLQLSGGERQRVGIARALLRRPRIYLLDEPTSMLDSQTELALQVALRRVADGATVIVVAHRLSTIVDADEIVVLEDGRIRERGSHLELLAKDGPYAAMWRQQTAGSA